jgi:hypothetical protein
LIPWPTRGSLEEKSSLSLYLSEIEAHLTLEVAKFK